MKNSLRLLATALALLLGGSAFAQTSGTTAPRHGPPPGVVNSDGTVTLPDGTVLPAPTVNSDGTITLPDGTVVDPAKDLPPPNPPFLKNADGSITLSDGTVIQPNADGTYTLPDGTVIDLSKAPPAGCPGHQGPPPTSG